MITGPRRTDDDPDGSGLAARIAGRPVPEVAAWVAEVRGADDPFGSGGPRAVDVGPAGWADALAGTDVSVAVWGSWWDGATADAVFRADARIGLVDGRIGPWDHEGAVNSSPLGRPGTEAVEPAEVVAFFDARLKGESRSPAPRRWFVAGAERWEEADAWPIGVETEVALAGPAGAFPVDFAATVGPDNRWTAGLLRPIPAPDRADAPGLRSWSSAAFPSVMRVFGAPTATCDVAVSPDEAALHVYLEAVDARGRVRLLTEGVTRVRGSAVVPVRLRPVAFELPAGAAVRLSVAGADADTFERVPATGPATLTFAAPCALRLPVVP